jgi:hypothetical protein
MTIHPAVMSISWAESCNHHEPSPAHFFITGDQAYSGATPKRLSPICQTNRFLERRGVRAAFSQASTSSSHSSRNHRDAAGNGMQPYTKAFLSLSRIDTLIEAFLKARRMSTTQQARSHSRSEQCCETAALSLERVDHEIAGTG